MLARYQALLGCRGGYRAEGAPSRWPVTRRQGQASEWTLRPCEPASRTGVHRRCGTDSAAPVGLRVEGSMRAAALHLRLYTAISEPLSGLTPAARSESGSLIATH